MAKVEAIDPIQNQSPPAVELLVRADASQLSIIRAVSAAIAGQADFDLDSIADVRLAMDEACSILILRALEGTTLSCRFQSTPEELRVTINAQVSELDTTSQRSFGWHVLNTLTDSIVMTRDADPEQANGIIATIEFTKTKVSDA